MINITWLGHSSMKIDYQNYHIVFDPYGPGTVPGLNDIQERAHLVLCSHEHQDHNSRQSIDIYTGVVNPFEILELHSYHDDVRGAIRGPNIIHVLQSKDVKIVHLGDIGCYPTTNQVKQMRQADVVFAPVGGHFTASPTMIKDLMDEIEARVVIPMHFKTRGFGYEIIGTVDAYLELCQNVKHVPSSSITVDSNTPKQTVVLMPKYQKPSTT